MLIPTWVIIPPALAALIVFMLLYWEFNPNNRVTDQRFLLGIACCAVVFAQMFILIQGYHWPIVSMLICLGAWGLLIGAVWMVWSRPPREFRTRQH